MAAHFGPGRGSEIQPGYPSDHQGRSGRAEGYDHGRGQGQLRGSAASAGGDPPSDDPGKW